MTANEREKETERGGEREKGLLGNKESDFGALIQLVAFAKHTERRKHTFSFPCF